MTNLGCLTSNALDNTVPLIHDAPNLDASICPDAAGDMLWQARPPAYYAFDSRLQRAETICLALHHSVMSKGEITGVS